MKNLTKMILLCMMLVSFQACEKETITTTTAQEYPGVDVELWEYFQSFEEASAQRGLPIDLVAAGIHGRIEEVDVENIVGMCSYNPNATHQITIDKAFWNRASRLRRELIVFHELGHCFLKLGHNDETNSDGRCKSIMRSGFSGCVDIYTHDNRDEYQDELFRER